MTVPPQSLFRCRAGMANAARRFTLAMLIAALAGGMLSGCDRSATPDKIEVPGKDGALKTVAPVRAERRAYDGAPPVIAHQNFGITCSSCHTQRGMDVPGVGFAPPNPHEATAGMSAASNCRQCHVFSETGEVFVENTFAGLRQDLREGKRLNPLAPPTLPHRVFMRENCAACHAGPAAREEIRCTHPERSNCRQCHVPVTTDETFDRASAAPL